MLDSYQKPSGAQYTGTVAFLVPSLIFGPAVLVLPRLPLVYLSVLPALALSLLCIALAWLTWKKYSQFAIPSLESCHAGRYRAMGHPRRQSSTRGSGGRSQ